MLIVFIEETLGLPPPKVESRENLTVRLHLQHPGDFHVSKWKLQAFLGFHHTFRLSSFKRSPPAHRHLKPCRRNKFHPSMFTLLPVVAFRFVHCCGYLDNEATTPELIYKLHERVLRWLRYLKRTLKRK